MKYIFFVLTLVASLIIFDYLLMEVLIFFMDVLKNYFWVVIIVILFGLFRFADIFISLAALPVILASLIIETPASKKIAIVLFTINYIYILISLFGANYGIGMNILVVVVFGVVTWALMKREQMFLRVNESQF
jgi:hypothetical protein